MSVHETRYGTFEVKYREAGRQRSKSFHPRHYGSRAEAKRAAHDFDHAQARRRAEGRPVLRRKDLPTLREFAVSWLATKRNLTPETEAYYDRLLCDHVLPELGHLSLLDLRPAVLGRWQQDRLEAGAGPAAVGRAGQLLGQILKRAVAVEYLDANPMAAIDPPAYRRRDHRWASPAQVELLRAWFLGRRDLASATLVAVLGYVGIRPQDALGLYWQDVLDKRIRVIRKCVDGEIRPGSKTGNRYLRTIDIPAQVSSDLAEWRIASARVQGLVFPRRGDGKPWKKYDWDNWRSQRFVKACAAAGLKRFVPYDLRHTAATLMIAAGASAAEVAYQLGHSVAESTGTYQHLLDEARGEPPRPLEMMIRTARARVFGDQQERATA
jgi:integrase